MRRIRDERGQTSAENLGVVVAVAFLFGALVAAEPGVGRAIKSGIQGAICCIAGGSCESSLEAGAASGTFEGAGSLYVGRVAGGDGWQFLTLDRLNPADVLRRTGQDPLE
jgi:hypothetical protein